MTDKQMPISREAMGIKKGPATCFGYALEDSD
jgi:hypothetical protein